MELLKRLEGDNEADIQIMLIVTVTHLPAGIVVTSLMT